MKNLIFLIGLAISVSACNQSSQQVKTNSADTVSAEKKSVQYTCPMHPEIVKNKPGTCEKCGMDLVEKQSK